MQSYRTPIVSVLGHADHGKTSLLDNIRGSNHASEEVSSITQHIGATEVSVNDIKSRAPSSENFELPGLLFIDTPGHHAFTSLRSRGGSLSDIAILVIDVTDGVQPQTEEAIKILKKTGTPFVIAANKIDAVPGWRSVEESSIKQEYEAQSARVKETIRESVYSIVGDLSKFDIDSDVFWNVNNFTSVVGIIPTSAETGSGVGALLSVLMGLSQQYLSDQMQVDESMPAEGKVVEVDSQHGYGTVVDSLLYEGSLSVGDELLFSGKRGVSDVVTVRSLLIPNNSGYTQTDSVVAAAGVRIAANGLDSISPGAEFRQVTSEEEVSAVESELPSMEQKLATSESGLVLKADTLGSLEALYSTVKENGYDVVRAEVGDISRKDLTVAETADEFKNRVVLGFGVDTQQSPSEFDVEVITDEVIYQLLESYEGFVEECQRRRREQVFNEYGFPAEIKPLEQFVFKNSNPAIFGVEITEGRLQDGAILENSEGERIGEVKRIEKDEEKVDVAKQGEQVSISVSGANFEEDVKGQSLRVQLPERAAEQLQDLQLPSTVESALSTLMNERQKHNPFWGV